eukprot:COSAG02_NODE_6547_length_3502_cov_58.042766_3_plen_155_part_00
MQHSACTLQYPSANATVMRRSARLSIASGSTASRESEAPHNDVINGAFFIVPKQVVATKIIAIDEVVQPPSKQSLGDCQPTNDNCRRLRRYRSQPRSRSHVHVAQWGLAKHAHITNVLFVAFVNHHKGLPRKAFKKPVIVSPHGSGQSFLAPEC